jgi:hypothetical protein
MDIIQPQNNIYFFVAVALTSTVLKNTIPKNIIELFHGETYNVIMLLLMCYIGKTNIILAIILLIFFHFSIKLDSKNTNSSQPIEKFENISVKPFVIRPEYFRSANEKKINNESFTLENDINNYATGRLNYESELFTGMTF